MSAEVGKANGGESSKDHSQNCSSDSDTEISTDDVYEIQKIVGHKFEGRKLLYRIRWVGYGPSDDTWEPEGNLLGSTSVEMVDEYKKRNSLDKKTPRKTPPKPKPVKKTQQSAFLSDSDFDVSFSSQEQPKQRVSSSPEKEEEMALTDDTGWFGVKADEAKRDLRNLFVTDRKLTQTEKLLTDIHDSGANRMTRSQIREMLHSSTSSLASPVTKPKTRRFDSSHTFRRSASPEKPSEPKVKKRKHEEDESPEVKFKKPKKVVPVDDSSPEVVHKSHKKKAKKEKRREEEEEKPSKHEKSHKSSKNGKSEEERKKKSLEKLERRAEKEHRTGGEPGAPKPTAQDSVKAAAAPPVIRTKMVTSEKKNHLFMNYRIPKGPEKVAQSTNGEVKKPKESVPQGTPITYGSHKLFINDTINVNNLFNELPKENLPIEMDQQGFNEAVLSGKTRIAKSALACGSNKLDVNWKDENGSTLLHKICEAVCDPQHNPDEMIDVLINYGADAGLVDKKRGQNPLHAACVNRRVCHVVKLLRMSVNMDAVDASGETALGMVMRTMPVEVTRLFLTSGVNYFPVIRPKSGFTKSQLKPVLQYSEKLQTVMDKIRDSLFKNVLRFHTYSNVYQTTLFGKEEVEFQFFNGINPVPQKNEVRYTVVLCALGRNILGSPAGTITGQCPVVEMYINDRKVDVVTPMIHFVYGAPTLQENTVQNIRMKLLRQNVPDLLFVQVISVFRQSVSTPTTNAGTSG